MALAEKVKEIIVEQLGVNADQSEVVSGAVFISRRYVLSDRVIPSMSRDC